MLAGFFVEHSLANCQSGRLPLSVDDFIFASVAPHVRDQDRNELSVECV